MAQKPIFFDATGRRAARLSVLGWIVAVVSTILGIAFIASLVAVPQFTSVTFNNRLTPVIMDKLVKKATAPGLLKAAAALSAKAHEAEVTRARWEKIAHILPARTLSASLRPPPGRSLSIGFYETFEAESYPALKRALPHLDWLVPNWLGLTGPNEDLKPVLDQRVIDLIRTTKPNVAILPMLQNIDNGVWNGEGLGKLLADDKRRAALLDQIVSFVAANKLSGVAVDFEEVPVSAHENLGAFLAEMSQAFAPHGWIIVQAAPFEDETWPYEAYANIVDYTLLMAYDEHDEANEPGSIAGQSWFEKTLARRMQVLDPDWTIVGIGAYGYDWHGGQPADNLTFQDAVLAARDSEADIDFDDDTGNLHFSYMENAIKHDVWFLDGVTAFNEIHAADIYRPAGYALWRLGSEDPSIWPVMGQPYGAAAPQTLREIPTSEDVDFEGAGEILRVAAHPTAGSRKIEIDRDTGMVDDETYTKIPTSYVIQSVGAVPHKVALSFDDGPDPEWTPQILDILKEKNVHATFFIIGENAEAHPGLVERMLAEGHEVGNHTFTHPNLEDTPPWATALELNATQRLFQALTGRSMRLWRPPYLGDAEPSNEDQIAPVELAQSMGYITVGVHVDPGDWELPPASYIVSRSLELIRDPNPEIGGNIVLLHDSGGDRSPTVQALPLLIDKLRAGGYQIVLVSELAGMTRDQAMPRLSAMQTLLTDRVVFLTVSWLGQIFYYCFVVAICLGIARLFLLAGLSFWNRRKDVHGKVTPRIAGALPVSVVIPAYNEEKVIAITVEKILASDYADIQVIVVDDGSKDDTSQVLKKAFGNDPRVTIVTIPNGGKANALNIGLAQASGEILVALDADTLFGIDTISRLARWFSDPLVGAVAGNAKVGNRINTITRWQALEYIVAQNLERRALAALGTLTVVPGAVGAWRRSVLNQLGGFPLDTLAEDQDLTIAVQRAGFRVLFDSSAIAWTEAPTTFRGLARQRFRWAYGTLQCLWKYRDVTFNRRYGALGLIALPQVWLFQIILSALAPLVDLLFLWQVIGAWLNYIQHGAEFNDANVTKIVVYYCVFMVVDLTAAIVGFVMEKGEDWSLLWWLMLQRFGYRQLMYYVVVRSISAALRGPSVSWGKLERTGTVSAGRV
jgi:cellulose synthase/poly-beta-1,6-N-acetylglucosamine synthase-like glycosyltransferase/peptidoglycan/xylan/chitin deacetylase (PgdA/CDA1 family)/spore germination protein YaaH